jgi:hypothetical protein
VIAAAAATTLAGCQTSATGPDGTEPIKEALREHYAGVDNVDLIEIKEVAIRDSETAEATVALTLNDSQPVDSTARINHDAEGWSVTDAGYPTVSEVATDD